MAQNYNCFAVFIQKKNRFTSRGRTENQNEGEYSEVPREVKILRLPIFDCYETIGLHNIISRRGLCVGGNGTGPCNGDSGGGFLTAQGGKWFLRGITSVSLLNSLMECDVNRPAVFTNVEKFSSWIEDILDGGEQIKCKFEYTGKYWCDTQSSITHRDIKIFQVSGLHVGSRTNRDVDYFSSYKNGKLKFLPIALGRFFPNLIRYKIEYSGVLKMFRKNFKDLPKLEFLEISNSQLKKIPRDAFYDLNKFEHLELVENQIEAIDSATFVHNTNLRKIILRGNKIQTLDLLTFKRNWLLFEIDFSNNLIASIGPELITPLERVVIVNFKNNTCIDKRWKDFGSLTPLMRKEFKEICVNHCQ